MRRRDCLKCLTAAGLGLGFYDAKQRCDGFVRWLAARQRGVSRAKAAAAKGKCRVLHATEVNRVWDLTRGIPTIASHVLPRVPLDAVSWSSYDGMGSVVKAWQGLELIAHYARGTPEYPQPAIFVGEIGLPEHGKSEKEVVEWWDRAIGVLLARNVPWILHWELYCNEPLDKDKNNPRPRRADEMRGFWLLRPDGSLSHAGKYLKSLLDRAGQSTSGGTLP